MRLRLMRYSAPLDWIGTPSGVPSGRRDNRPALQCRHYGISLSCFVASRRDAGEPFFSKKPPNLGPLASPRPYGTRKRRRTFHLVAGAEAACLLSHRPCGTTNPGYENVKVIVRHSIVMRALLGGPDRTAGRSAPALPGDRPQRNGALHQEGGGSL